jgi:hypothetical protein
MRLKNDVTGNYFGMEGLEVTGDFTAWWVTSEGT